MKTENIFDLIVIGAGSGGLNIASFMNSIGLRVLLIDRTTGGPALDPAGGRCSCHTHFDPGVCHR